MKNYLARRGNVVYNEVMNTNESINYAVADETIKAAEVMIAALQSMRAAGDVNEWHWVDADKIFRSAVRSANLAMETAEAAEKYDLSNAYEAASMKFGDERAAVEGDLYHLRNAA